MSNQFPALFKPLTLRHKTLRNRIVFGSHTANMSEMGLPGERHRAYYEERARGGAAMIVVEPVPVHRTAVLTRGNFRHSSDEIVRHFRKVTDAVHDHGAVICHQLISCRPARRFRQLLRAQLVALGPAVLPRSDRAATP
jgi:2,4-dienoyl-CoA reductase-like NADH-dependent reductase (Old Yellow Enzyme family)